MNCTRFCGKIKVPFPFGLEKEDGCSARNEFELYCNASASTLHPNWVTEARITNINITEGFLDTEGISGDTSEQFSYGLLYIPDRDSRRVQWAIANLTCQEALRNITTYACVSRDSTCLHIASTVIGYRCKCNDGYVGNPYVTGPDGCQGTPPSRCTCCYLLSGLHHNTNSDTSKFSHLLMYII